ncbi:SMC-Scp complex subunit ScpB [Thiohalorhabdus sp.]|uniref:SMC-Scp complex subunit ScpB n=1 Tax=Thiohalorhabdus sp. TaxID=3094134 RepID=UPI002FC2D738
MSWEPERLQAIVEAALFASGDPLSLSGLQRLFEDHEAPAQDQLRAALTALDTAYQGRGVCLVATGGGYQFQTAPATNPWVLRLFQSRSPRFSRAVLETLAIIAYRQPVTRSEIEEVRGVSLSSGVLKTLTERDWVKVVGRKDVPGRPSLYATTPYFLSYFGLNSLEDLPPLKAIPEGDMDALVEQLDQGQQADGQKAGDRPAEGGEQDSADG